MRICNVETGKVGEPLKAPGGFGEISPDGRTVAFSAGPNLIRFWQFEGDRHWGSLVRLANERHVKVSAEGHYAGSPGVEKQLIYIVKTAAGQETYTPEAFAQKYHWKNDPSQAVLAPSAAKAKGK